MTFAPFPTCAVIGHPIAHSLSPRLHQAFAGQFARTLDYQRIDATPEQFASTVKHFFNHGGRGLNVTLPHKVTAFVLATIHHPRAKWATAANTLWMQDGQLHADNTDGAGLINDLRRLNIALESKSITLLGAGGAAAGIVPLLLSAQPKQITIINRTPARARALAQSFNDPRVSADHPKQGDLVISTVSEGFNDLMMNCQATTQSVVYDLNYGARAESSKQWAQKQQLAWHDGLGMLIEQAALSFEIWHGVKPDTAPLHQGAF